MLNPHYHHLKSKLLCCLSVTSNTTATTAIGRREVLLRYRRYPSSSSWTLSSLCSSIRPVLAPAPAPLIQIRRFNSSSSSHLFRHCYYSSTTGTTTTARTISRIRRNHNIGRKNGLGTLGTGDRSRVIGGWVTGVRGSLSLGLDASKYYFSRSTGPETSHPPASASSSSRSSRGTLPLASVRGVLRNRTSTSSSLFSDRIITWSMCFSSSSNNVEIPPLPPRDKEEEEKQPANNNSNNDNNNNEDDLIARISKQDVQVSKDKPWLWDLGLPSLWPEWKRMVNVSSTSTDSSTTANTPAATTTPAQFLTDISAGITIGCIAVPLSLAIAVASGVPPAVGLVTAAVSGVAGGLLGGTTLAVTGPAAAISLLVVGAVTEHGLQALPIITLVCGGMQAVSGMTRLGTLAKLVPVSVIAGFTTGVGAMILSGQVPKALGLTGLPAGLNPIETIGFIAEHLGDINPAAAALAAGTSAAMFFLPKLHPKMPSALLAVGTATLATTFMGLDVALIGTIPSGLEAFTSVLKVPEIPPVEQWTSLGATIFLIYAMTSAESLLSCAALEKMRKTAYRYNPDQELVGQGCANMAAGLFSGMPVTSVIARSSLNVKLQSATRLPALVQAGFVFSSVVFMSESIALIPMPALSGMLITTGCAMLNPAEFKHCFAVQKLDAIPFLVTIGGMISLGLAEGIGIGCLSAWALNYDYGKLHVSEMELPHKGGGGGPGGTASYSGEYYYFDPMQPQPATAAATAEANHAALVLQQQQQQQRITSLENETVVWQGKVLTLETDKSQLQGQVGTLTAENLQLRKRLEMVELENSQLRGLFESISTTTSTNASGSSDSSDLECSLKSKSTIGWQLKGPVNFASMFKIDDLIHRIEEMKTDEKVIVLDMQETTSIEFTGVEELVNRLVEVAEKNPGTTIQMWNCHGELLNALVLCDPTERIARYCSSTSAADAPFHFPAKEEKVERAPIPYWYDSLNFQPDAK